MVKAVIFDLNGIFIVSPKLSERFQKDFGVPIAEFVPKLSEIMDKVRLPNGGRAFDYWQPVLRNWGVNLSEQEFWNYRFQAEKVSEPTLKLAQELKSKGVKVFILSNNFKERADYYGHYPWFTETVDKVYFSWQTGFVKPDPEAWKLILKENNLKPEECIYFDDLEKNVKAAQSVGMRAYIYEDVEDMRNKIQS